MVRTLSFQGVLDEMDSHIEYIFCEAPTKGNYIAEWPRVWLTKGTPLDSFIEGRRRRRATPC